jgi:hypothetical protein
MKVGDTIECRDKADMVETMYQLQREGIETDFVYELDGKKGLWLEVVKVIKDKKKNEK